MRGSVSLIVLLLASAASAVDAPSSESEIVVRADIARTEIERVLNADNLDTEAMDPRSVADIIVAIPRGRAPEDFWLAYQKHVDAWTRLAELSDRTADVDELAVADRMINLTFDEVERIARGYGARMPMPIAEVRRTA